MQKNEGARGFAALCAQVPILLALFLYASLAQASGVDVAAAKKEGQVVWYTSTPIEQAQKIAKQFESETAIKVEMFRSGGSAILRRFLQEQQAGRTAVDVMTTSDPAATASLARKGMFVAFKPKNFDKIVEEGRDKDGYFVAQRLNLMTIYARSDKLPAPDLPKTWGDLIDAKYKGKLVMTDPSFTALQLTVVGMMSKNLGWDYYEKLRKNDIMIVQGNQQVSDNIKRSERLIAVGALDSYAADDRKAGHPVVTIVPTDGTFVIPSPTAIIKGSPNPNAAKLFAEFMIGDGVQKLFPEDGGYAARKDIPPPADGVELDKIKIIPIDYDHIEKESVRIKKRFNEIFQ
jgi:iron(III) transport system substrate-binding protein